MTIRVISDSRARAGAGAGAGVGARVWGGLIMTVNAHLELNRYQPNICIRAGITFSVITAIVVVALGSAGYFTNPSLFTRAINVKLAISVSFALVILAGGGALVIRKVLKQPNAGKVFGFAHWNFGSVKFEYEQRSVQHFISLDKSLLNKLGKGVAYGHTKPIDLATLTGVCACYISPIYTATVIAYNALRFFVIPFYILTQMAREKPADDSLFLDQRRFVFSDILKEMGKSLKNVVLAPFYGVAFFFASFYAILDPLNGVKLGSLIETDWNQNVPLDNGIWLMNFSIAKDWQWEGGGEPEDLGKNGFYVAGSWQRMYQIKMKNRFEMEEIYSLMPNERIRFF